MFRGMYDVPGHGILPVFDYENEVPTNMKGRRVGIVEATASYDLRNYGSSMYMEEHSPAWPTAVYKLLAVVAIVICVIIVTWLFTATSVTQTENGYYVQVPGAVYWVDPNGNLISQQGTPTLEGIGGIVQAVVIGAVALVGLYLTVKFVVPAVSERRARPQIPAAVPAAALPIAAPSPA